MNKAVFLDRDGVINEVLSKRVKFVNKPEQFFLLEGVGEAVKKLNEEGYKVFVVTNQGGIGLGYMKEQELHRVHEKMISDLGEFGASINDIAYCHHKPKAGCACRKPEPKMILDLAKKYDIDLSKSYMIGDRDPDIEAGQAAGVHSILIGKREPRAQFSNLAEAVNWILQKGRIV
ncbi:D-glycero-alpha-D-manno-heptose-1,7-bisphosphate 7-phosphatase [Bacillus taeanensis]|uniref:D,D-heptose 1,7-bisphosphate phosphatase n=1 Tax=Bacillus taeanensis TaxID=273032 RepID=A0A366XS35_9BACI|nr:HAD family hydrolase [Bacillus taeanensis]RBW69190.1 D-glycero-beta-D-manno-heptose-1,7-bisphosphate 7-phosphatase [Bacillus taeanensis]